MAIAKVWPESSGTETVYKGNAWFNVSLEKMAIDVSITYHLGETR